MRCTFGDSLTVATWLTASPKLAMSSLDDGVLDAAPSPADDLNPAGVVSVLRTIGRKSEEALNVGRGTAGSLCWVTLVERGRLSLTLVPSVELVPSLKQGGACIGRSLHASGQLGTRGVGGGEGSLAA